MSLRPVFKSIEYLIEQLLPNNRIVKYLLWLRYGPVSQSLSFSQCNVVLLCHFSFEIDCAPDSQDGLLWMGVCACTAHSNSAWLPHPRLLPAATAWAAGLSGAAVNYGCMGPDWEYRSSSSADERCIALTAGVEVGRRWSKYRDASNSSAWAV